MYNRYLERYFDIVEVGDRVWDFVQGDGVVIFFDGHSEPYPIGVKFDSGYLEYYTLDGKYGKNLNQSLFWSKKDCYRQIINRYNK